jgi:TPR repeat protein
MFKHRWATAAAIVLGGSVFTASCTLTRAAEDAGPSGDAVATAAAASADSEDTTETAAAATKSGSWLESLANRMGSAAQRCAREAGDPADSSSTGAGKTLDEVDAEKAMAACAEVIDANPGDVLGHYHVGRAALANGDLAKALKAFKTAADGGHCGAQFYLGLAAEDAWQEGSSIDLEQARTRYRAALDCQYAPAAEALEAITLDLDIFVRPDLVEILADGSDEAIARANSRRPLVSSYLQGFFAQWGEHWVPGGESCATTPIYTPGALNRALDAAERGDAPTSLHRPVIDALMLALTYLDPVWGGGTQSIERLREIGREQGKTDSLRWITRFGCSSPMTLRVAQSITKFSKTPKSIVDIAKEQIGDASFRDQVAKHALDLKAHGRFFDELLNVQ